MRIYECFNLQVNNAGVGGSMMEENCNILTIKDLIEGDFVTISTENEVRQIISFSKKNYHIFAIT